MAKLQLAKSTPKLAAVCPFDVGLAEIMAFVLTLDATITINIGLLNIYGHIPEFEVIVAGVSVEVAKPFILRVTLTVAQSPWANLKVSVYYRELDN